jgi:hypothetical protein
LLTVMTTMLPWFGAEVTNCCIVVTRSAVVSSAQLTRCGCDGGTTQSRNPRASTMTSDEDFSQLDDPEFLAERSRVRAELEHTPENAGSPDLTDRYQRLNDEFLRRASAAWGGEQ